MEKAEKIRGLTGGGTLFLVGYDGGRGFPGGAGRGKKKS